MIKKTQCILHWVFCFLGGDTIERWIRCIFNFGGHHNAGCMSERRVIFWSTNTKRLIFSNTVTYVNTRIKKMLRIHAMIVLLSLVIYIHENQ